MAHHAQSCLNYCSRTNVCALIIITISFRPFSQKGKPILVLSTSARQFNDHKQPHHLSLAVRTDQYTDSIGFAFQLLRERASFGLGQRQTLWRLFVRTYHLIIRGEWKRTDQVSKTNEDIHFFFRSPSSLPRPSPPIFPLGGNLAR